MKGRAIAIEMIEREIGILLLSSILWISQTFIAAFMAEKWPLRTVISLLSGFSSILL